ETHVHADHITSAGRLRESTGASVIVPAGQHVANADREMGDGDEIRVGAAPPLRVLATPGHTAGSVSLAWDACVFTGDALFIDGCGRTDFQGGNAGTLHDSVTRKLFALDDATLVYPGHDYHGRSASTIGYERRCN